MTTTSTTQLAQLPDAATRNNLEDWGALEEATGPAMQTHGLTLWEEGEQSSGIWQCSAGPSYWVLETHEFVHLLSGHMTCTEEGGEPVQLGPGDTMLFPKGWKGTWDIADLLRKLYVIF